MILEHHYAVVWRVRDWPPSMTRKEIMTQAEWEILEESHQRLHVVILEAWDITKGKCISN